MPWTPAGCRCRRVSSPCCLATRAAPEGTLMVEQPPRADFINEALPTGFGVVEQRLGAFQRLAEQAWLRKSLILMVLALAWEGYARWLDNALLVPTFSATVMAFIQGV